MAEEKKCLLVTDDAGNVYSLRPELLDATRMSPEDVETCRRLAAEQGSNVESLDLAMKNMASNPSFSGPFRALNSLVKIRPPGAQTDTGRT